MAEKTSFLHAVKWSYVASWGARASTALFTFIFAAILGPREFGIITIAVIYISFIQMFLDQGFAAALIQRKDLDPDHLDAVFWANLIFSGVLIAVSVLFGRFWAAANHLPVLVPIIFVLSLCIPIEGLDKVQSALLQRQMDFKSLSLRTNAGILVGGVIGIIMAFTGFGVWALVGQQVIRDLTSLLLLWKLSPWRPRFKFPWRRLKDLMGFSASNFAAQLGLFADMQSAPLLQGAFFGPVAVGLYRMADRVTNTILVTTTSSLQSVSLPEFSRHQDNPRALRQSMLTCIRLSSIAAVPALSGLAAISVPLMNALGSKWAPASDALRILCVLGIVQTFSYFTGPLLQALSRPHHVAVLVWVRAAVGLSVILVVARFVQHSPVHEQLIGVAMAQFVVGALIFTPILVIWLLRLTGISVLEFVKVVAPSFGAAGAAVAIVTSLQLSGMLDGIKPILVVFIESGLGGIGVLLALLILEPGFKRWLFDTAQKYLAVIRSSFTPTPSPVAAVTPTSVVDSVDRSRRPE